MLIALEHPRLGIALFIYDNNHYYQFPNITEDNSSSVWRTSYAGFLNYPVQNMQETFNSRITISDWRPWGESRMSEYPVSSTEELLEKYPELFI